MFAVPQPPTVIGGPWRSLGPTPIVNEKDCCTNTTPPAVASTFGNASGRVTALVTDPTNPGVVFMGSAGGGVWKSANGGLSWVPLTDFQPSLAIGALAIDPSGQTIYAATGEANGADSQAGQGILKSTDGGLSWVALAPQFAGAHIGGLMVDRLSPSRLFAATDLGLYRSQDGGTTWAQVALGGLTGIPGSPPPSQAVTQVVQDPGAPARLWVSAGDFCQTEAGDVLISNDGGASWSVVTPSFLRSTSGASRVGLGVGGQNVAYLAAADCRGNLLDLEKSLTAGTSWSRIPPGTPGAFNYFNVGGGGQGEYDNIVAVDPVNPNKAVFGGITILATRDGGASFSDVGRVTGGGVIHPDFHAVAFTGADSFYAGNDGGVWSTTTLGGTGSRADWTNLNATLGTVQFYQGSALDLNHILGGTQDNGSAGNFPGAAGLPAWQEYDSGDGGFTAIDPTPGSTTVFTVQPGLDIFKGQTTLTGAPTSPYDSFVPAGPCRRGSQPPDPACNDPRAFVAPLVMDPTNPQRLLAGTNRVYQSLSGGLPAGPSGWAPISGDLTTGTQFTTRGDRLQVTALGSPTSSGTVITGSRFGAVSISTNATSANPQWTNISSNLPVPSRANFVFPNSWISGVAVNPANPAEAWVTIGGLNIPHVWHTVTAGSPSGTIWSDLTGTGTSAVPNEIVNGIAIDPFNRATVYVGTDFGVLVCSTCGGSAAAPAWAVLGTGLPNVKVQALTFTQDGGTLIAWTHGRGAWAFSVPLGVSPSSLTFTAATGGLPPGPQTLSIVSRAGASLPWTASASTSSGGTWLTICPSPGAACPPGATSASGSAASGSPSPLSVNINLGTLAPGTYTGTVLVSAAGTQVSIGVTLTLTMGKPIFPGQFTPLAPARILDTRGTGNTLGPGQTLEVLVAGAPAGGVPAMTSATPPSSVVLNVTATNTTAAGFLTVYPTGVGRPLASNLNFVAGQTVPNLVEVALGSNGSVTVFNPTGFTDVVIDVAGWVATPGTVSGAAGLYRPLVPARLLDTRAGRTMQPGQILPLQVSGAGPVPASGVSGVVLNVTVTNPSTAGFLTVFPSGTTPPLASNLNFVARQTVPNRVMVKLGANGQVSLYNPVGTTDVVVDVGGWFTDGSDPSATGGQFTGVVPTRILDTRVGTGGFSSPLGPGKTIRLLVAGQATLPAPPAPKGVVANVTVTNTTAAGFLTVFPSDATTLPLASDVNWIPGLTVPNLVVVRLAADGSIAIFNSGGTTDVIVDVVGWYN